MLTEVIAISGALLSDAQRGKKATKELKDSLRDIVQTLQEMELATFARNVDRKKQFDTKIDPVAEIRGLKYLESKLDLLDK